MLFTLLCNFLRIIIQRLFVPVFESWRNCLGVVESFFYIYIQNILTKINGLVKLTISLKLNNTAIISIFQESEYVSELTYKYFF